MAPADNKLSWQGSVLAVQPRIRLLRSFDQRTHSYLGYALRVDGKIDDETREFTIGIGTAAQAKHQFRRGNVVRGLCVPVLAKAQEAVEFYKASQLKVLDRGVADPGTPPPWHGVPPELPTYRERGHRRLDARTYASHCSSCIWGCKMPVEMTIDQWNPRQKRYRTETFCYGPKSCTFYRPGPTRKVPGRKGMSWEEEDWVDEQETAHRGPDE
jgi:hypothetical protein